MTVRNQEVMLPTCVVLLVPPVLPSKHLGKWLFLHSTQGERSLHLSAVICLAHKTIRAYCCSSCSCCQTPKWPQEHSALHVLTTLFIITVTFKVQAKCSKTSWPWSGDGRKVGPRETTHWLSCHHCPDELFMMPSYVFCISAHIVPNVRCYCVNKARMSASCVISAPLLLCVCICFIHLL